MLTTIIYSAIANGIYAASGYLRKERQSGDFKPQKFATTVIIGAIVGGVISCTGMTPEATLLALESVGATALIQNGLKTIYRKFF